MMLSKTDALTRAVRHSAGNALAKQELRFHLISEHEDRMVQRITVGETHYFAKTFDHTRNEARKACEREIYAMTVLRDTGLAPRLLAFDRTDAFVITEAVAGHMLETVLTSDTVAERAYQIGEWSAHYIRHQPRRDLDIDWFDYIRQYSGIITSQNEAEARESFAGCPTPQFALAKHDQSPMNFIVTPTNALIGIDFERTRFKPVGWDVIAAAWVLLKRFPDQDSEIFGSLEAGWNSVGFDELPDMTIVRFFAHQAARLDWSRQPYT